jgi:hypothetical protein
LTRDDAEVGKAGISRDDLGKHETMYIIFFWLIAWEESGRP